MSWSFSVAPPVDPAPCHDAAETLRDVARAAEVAADFLARQAVVPGEDFSGEAAQSYRAASAALGDDSAGVADDSRALASALDDYAVRIAAVRRTLTRVRDDAVSQGFELTADDLVEWIPAPGTDLDAAYRTLEARAVRAHADADAACADWWRAVQEHTTGSPASPPVVPAPTVAPAPDQPAPTGDRRHRTAHTARRTTTATGLNAEPPAHEAAAHSGRRTPSGPDVDFEFVPPVRWQPNPDLLTPPHCPTATEGVQP